MSFAKARERQQSEPEQANPNHGLMCRMPGCSLRWSVDISHGRVCSFHDESLSRAGNSRPSAILKHPSVPIPLRNAVRPFVEPEDREGF